MFHVASATLEPEDSQADSSGAICSSMASPTGGTASSSSASVAAPSRAVAVVYYWASSWKALSVASCSFWVPFRGALRLSTPLFPLLGFAKLTPERALVLLEAPLDAPLGPGTSPISASFSVSGPVLAVVLGCRNQFWPHFRHRADSYCAILVSGMLRSMIHLSSAP